MAKPAPDPNRFLRYNSHELRRWRPHEFGFLRISSNHPRCYEIWDRPSENGTKWCTMSGPSMHNAGGCFYRVLLVCILLSFACGHDMTWWHSFLIPSKALHFWGHYCAGHSASALAANVPELARARRDGRGPVCNAPGARQPPKPLPAAGRLGALSVYQPTCTRITLSNRSFRFGSVLRIVAEHLLGTHNARVGRVCRKWSCKHTCLHDSACVKMENSAQFI